MNPSTKILLINNDKDLGEALAFQLPLGEKYQIIETSDETSALAQINNNFCDLVIINSQFSALKECNITKNLRLAGYKKPIIMLINQNSNLDIPDNQNHKADEYIIKPFRYPELLKSIETHLNRFKKSENVRETGKKSRVLAFERIYILCFLSSLFGSLLPPPLDRASAKSKKIAARLF